MVTPAKQQMPHVPAGGDKTSFHALLVTSPSPESIKILRGVLDMMMQTIKADASLRIDLDYDEAVALVAAIKDFLR